MNKEEDFLALLRQKQEHMFDILRMTRDTVLEGEDEEADAEKYIELMEMREESIVQLKRLDDEMKLPEYDGIRACGSLKEQEADFRRKIKGMAEQVMALDKEMKTKIPKIREHFHKEVKELNRSKNMRSVYERDFIFSEGYYVDKKN